MGISSGQLGKAVPIIRVPAVSNQIAISMEASRGAGLSMPIFLLLCALQLGLAPNAPEPSPVTGEAKQAFLQQWGKHMQTMHTLHMVFTQEKHLRLLHRPLVAQGELWRKGDTLRYVLKNSAGETEIELHKDAHTVNIYYPQLRTLEVIDLRSTPALPMGLPFLTEDPTALTQTYDTALFVTDGLHTLQLHPKDPQALFAELCLTFKDVQPQTFVRVEKSGNRITMHISSFTPNVDIGEDQLALSVPAGTAVTYPLQ